MSRARELPSGRWWSKKQLAAHFSRSVEWVSRNYNDLLKNNMPDCDPLFKAWDSEAIIAWENKRSRIDEIDDDSEMRDYREQLANGRI